MVMPSNTPLVEQLDRVCDRHSFLHFVRPSVVRAWRGSGLGHDTLPLVNAFQMEAVGALAICGLAAVRELRKGDIPNVFSFAALIGAVVACAMDREWLYHGVGLALVIVCGLAAWKRDWIGGGAFKLGVGVSALAGSYVAGAMLGLFAALLGFFVLAEHFKILKGRTVPSTPVIAVAIVAGVLLHQVIRVH